MSFKGMFHTEETKRKIGAKNKDRRIENLELYGNNGQHMSKHKKEYWLSKKY